MILCDRDLKRAISEGKIAIEPLGDTQFGPTSVDLHLGTILLKYTCRSIELGKSNPETTSFEISSTRGYNLQPGEFVLGCTLETIRLDNGFQGFIETKGDVARAGIQVHSCDGHVEPGSDHPLTLEISNRNHIPIILYGGILICQLYVHLLTGMCDSVYRGKYYGQRGPTTYRIE